MSTTGSDFDSEETGLNLFDDQATAAGSFPHSMLGYDRHAVDVYVREVEAQVSQLKMQLRERNREIEFIKEQQGKTDFTRLGAHATGLLRAAEAQASDIVQQGSHEAERIKAEARRTAAALREAAQQEADDVRLTGLAGLRDLRQQQAEVGKEALETARRDGDLITADARVKAEGLIEAATLRASALMEAASAEAGRLAQEAQRAATESRLAAERAAEESLAKAAETAKQAEATVADRLEQADKTAADVEARIAASRDEAQRIRAEAVASAEEIRLGAMRQSEETLAVLRERTREAETALEEKAAWRREQLEREIGTLEARRRSALAQLRNLKALAEESSQGFDNEPTTIIDKDVDPK